MRPCPTDRTPDCQAPTPPVIELLFGEPDPDAPVLVLVTSECAPLAAADDTWSQRDATLARRAQNLRANARLEGNVEAFDRALSLVIDTLSVPIFDPGGPVAIAARGGRRPVVWEVALEDPPARTTLHAYTTPPHWLAHAAAHGTSGHANPAEPDSRPVVHSATAVRVPRGRLVDGRIRLDASSHDDHGGPGILERSARPPAQWRSPGPRFTR